MTEQVVEVVAEVVVEPGSGPKKRKRRTKAEMQLAAQKPGETEVVFNPAPAPAVEELVKGYELAARTELAELALFEIGDQADMDLVGAMQREAFERSKLLESKRKELTAPLDQTKKGIMNLFKPALDFCTAIEKACKEKQAAFRLAVAKRQDEALAAVQAAGGAPDAATLVVAHGGEALDLPATSREIVEWTWVTVDATKVPEQYWKRVLDIDLINATVKCKGGQTDIAGIEVTRTVRIANKAVR